jgi:GST-like protein
MWQMGSGAVVGGGFGHFFSYAPVKLEYAIDRFTMETKRLLDVLDRHLGAKDGPSSCGAGGPFILGETYSIADMCIWPWLGNLVLGRLYGSSDTFLETSSYTHVRKLFIIARANMRAPLRTESCSNKCARRGLWRPSLRTPTFGVWWLGPWRAQVLAWAKAVLARPGVARGRMVNRTWGSDAEQLPNRHDRADFERETVRARALTSSASPPREM